MSAAETRASTSATSDGSSAEAAVISSGDGAAGRGTMAPLGVLEDGIGVGVGVVGVGVGVDELGGAVGAVSYTHLTLPTN